MANKAKSGLKQSILFPLNPNFKLFKQVIKLINSKYLLVSNVRKLQLIRGQTE